MKLQTKVPDKMIVLARGYTDKELAFIRADSPSWCQIDDRPNHTSQIVNHTDWLSTHDFAFDLYVKIDDDDIYPTTYIESVERDHQGAISYQSIVNSHMDRTFVRFALSGNTIAMTKHALRTAWERSQSGDLANEYEDSFFINSTKHLGSHHRPNSGVLYIRHDQNTSKVKSK